MRTGARRGTVPGQAEGLSLFVFPEENYVGGNGETLTLRNVLVRESDGYAGTSSARQADGSWRVMWTMRFTRVGSATAG